LSIWLLLAAVETLQAMAEAEVALALVVIKQQ